MPSPSRRRRLAAPLRAAALAATALLLLLAVPAPAGAASGWSTAADALPNAANVVRGAALEDGSVMLQGDLTPTTVLFDPVAGSGGNRLEIRGIELDGDDAADYAIAADACAGETLAPGETCAIALAFAPTAAGAAEGKLTVPSDLPGAPVEVVLGGAGTTPPDPPDEEPRPPTPPTPDPPAPPSPQPPDPPAPPAPPAPSPAARAPSIERFTLDRRCVRPLPGARSTIGLRLSLTRAARVRIEVARALGTGGLLVCPLRGSRGTFDGALAKPLTLTRGSTRTAVASSVLTSHTLSLRLRPALYRITARPYVSKGRLGRPAHRWLRVLAP